MQKKLQQDEFKQGNILVGMNLGIYGGTQKAGKQGEGSQRRCQRLVCLGSC